MCEQCVANAHVWIDILPGWWLVRAHKDGNEMKAGQWGLLHCNDPSLILTTDPRTNEHDRRCASEVFTGIRGQVPSHVWFKILDAAKSVGYDKEQQPILEYWLIARICGRVKESLGKVPFPINRSEGFFGVVDAVMEDDLKKYGEKDLYAMPEVDYPPEVFEKLQAAEPKTPDVAYPEDDAL